LEPKTLLIVKHTVTGEVRVFDATPDQVRTFNLDDSIDNAIAGWEVESPEQLARCGLTATDLLTLHNVANPDRKLDATQFIGQPKRNLAERAFHELPKLAKPYDLNTRRQRVAPSRPKPPSTPQAATPAKPVKARKDGTFLLPPRAKAHPAKASSCIAALIDATFKGATMEDLRKAVPKWKDPSIISGLRYDVHHKGYGVKSEVTDHHNGIVTFSLILPEGLDKPLPHLETKKK
jgi:hypothetical protein